jgi:UDP-N-acetylglucosamine--N-acetylmuramyl-(pentapeptide) pyrophosphoryl-undecaprenol N-acetylglucosamine transferase
MDAFRSAGIQVLWQTGKRYLPEIKSSLPLEDYPNIKAVDFISQMDLAYGAADVIVSRAGAMSIAELALVGKPTILVPSPNVSEDHQTRNAEALTKADAALLIADKDVVARLFSSVSALLADEDGCRKMAANMKSIAKPGAAAAVVDEIETLVKLSSRSK